MPLEVVGGGSQKTRIVFESPESYIACRTKGGSNFASGVVVVQVIAGDSAYLARLREVLVVLLNCDPVELSDVGFAIGLSPFFV